MRNEIGGGYQRRRSFTAGTVTAAIFAVLGFGGAFVLSTFSASILGALGVAALGATALTVGSYLLLGLPLLIGASAMIAGLVFTMYSGRKLAADVGKSLSNGLLLGKLMGLSVIVPLAALGVILFLGLTNPLILVGGALLSYAVTVGTGLVALRPRGGWRSADMVHDYSRLQNGEPADFMAGTGPKAVQGFTVSATVAAFAGGMTAVATVYAVLVGLSVATGPVGWLFAAIIAGVALIQTVAATAFAIHQRAVVKTFGTQPNTRAEYVAEKQQVRARRRARREEQKAERQQHRADVQAMRDAPHGQRRGRMFPPANPGVRDADRVMDRGDVSVEAEIGAGQVTVRPAAPSAGGPG